MKEYWPRAVVLDNGRPLALHTYDAVFSIQKARDQFKVWQDEYGYVLLASWIEVIDKFKDKKYIRDHRCYVDILGQVEKLK